MKNYGFSEGGFLKPKDAWDALSMKDKADMIGIAVKYGITTLSDIRDRYNEFAEGGNLYDAGGYAPSESIKKRISRWEGDAMVKDTIDPLSGIMAKKNRPFEEVTRGFVGAIPSKIREQVFSNPELADNLFSYAYNVGPGNFKKRVVPVLEKFYNGDATVDDVTSSMWASGDKKLRGLRNRRAEEKAGVRNALLGYAATSTVLKPTTPALVATNNYVSNPYPLLTEEVQPTPLFYHIEDRSTDISPSPEELERQERRGALDRFNTVMNFIGIKNPLASYTSNTGNSFLDTLGLFANEKADGGKIHIKPENRGKFTALKERTGHSATWFKEHGTPAQKKMATFALNARHWKHGFGGNLFDGTSEDTQQMQIGKPFWQSQTQEPTFMESLAEFNRQQEIKKQQQRQALKERINTVGKKLAEERIREASVEFNDNAWVETPLLTRKKNSHLSRRAEEGAKAHAAWEKEHPVLNTIGAALGASPFAVAATPLFAAAGEAAAPVLTNHYVDAVLTSGFGAHGLNHAINEGIDGLEDAVMTTLEVAPLGRLAKPMFNEAALAIENYRYPLGRPQFPDRYLTIKPQIKSYNNNITEVPFFTWGNDSRFKVSPTEEFYKDLHSQLSAAKKYKESPEYADLVRKAAQESEKLGIGDFPEDLFTAPNGKSLKLIFENRPKGQLGEYVPEDNVMRLDMLQSDGMEVPYHEGIHWQRVGNPDNIGPNFSKWWKARKSGQSDDVQQKLFENFRNSEEYNRYIKRRNADRYLEYKVDNALYPFADDYLRARGELQAHGLEAGRAIGLKPFLPYPGMKSALNAIDKARGYNPYLNDVKSGGEENVKRFWDILTGQYAPSLIPLGLVGTGHGLTNK